MLAPIKFNYIVLFDSFLFQYINIWPSYYTALIKIIIFIYTDNYLIILFIKVKVDTKTQDILDDFMVKQKKDKSDTEVSYYILK